MNSNQINFQIQFPAPESNPAVPQTIQNDCLPAHDYRYLLAAAAGRQWARLGIRRRSGVCVPLFSVYSSESIGAGELPDLKLLVGWCRKTGLSLIQLLPMNDVGFQFRPYDAESSFALDPLYLRLSELEGVATEKSSGALKKLKKRFPAGKARVNYKVKRAKLEFLWNVFKESSRRGVKKFDQFRGFAAYWLRDYARYRVLKEKNFYSGWENWPRECSRMAEKGKKNFDGFNEERIEFYEWLQWQLFEQFSKVRQYANDHEVSIVGDLPLLVARDSADVWAHPNYFNLDLAAGAPPDRYFAKGQRWGMPAYDWREIQKDAFVYLREKLRYAEHFYDVFRIDHAAGLFRLWTIPVSEPLENHGLNGIFDPPNEDEWPIHGRRLLSLILDSTKMLPYAEDLGTIPRCVFEVIAQLGIPGIDVQRWTRDWKRTYDFLRPEAYRKTASSVISNHDMLPFNGWWRYEADTVDETLFETECGKIGISSEALKPILFDLKASKYGRLRWKKKISSEQILLARLGVDGSAAEGVKELYRESYGEKNKFWSSLGLSDTVATKSSPGLLKQALKRASETASIFNIQLLQDWLGLDPALSKEPRRSRINVPGTSSPRNWSVVMPLSLEAMLKLGLNSEIREINKEAGRQ